MNKIRWMLSVQIQKAFDRMPTESEINEIMLNWRDNISALQINNYQPYYDDLDEFDRELDNTA